MAKKNKMSLFGGARGGKSDYPKSISKLRKHPQNISRQKKHAQGLQRFLTEEDLAQEQEIQEETE